MCGEIKRPHNSLPAEKREALTEKVKDKITKVMNDEYRDLRKHEVNPVDAASIVGNGWGDAGSNRIDEIKKIEKELTTTEKSRP